MKIAILCICYNSYKEFLTYYKSIRRSENLSEFKISIYLLDNSNTFDNKNLEKIKEISKLDTNFTYHKCNNDGYLGTVQNNISKLDFNPLEFKFISITNVDIKVEKDFFNILKDIKIDDSIGLLAPSIINKKNINKNPKLKVRKSVLKLVLNILVFSIPLAHKFQFMVNRYKTMFYEKLENQKSKIFKTRSQSTEIYCAHGSFVLFTRKGFNSIMNIKYPIFLFGEELFFAEILKSKNLKTLFVPSLIIFDDEHVSTGKLKHSTYSNLNKKALIYILKRFYINNNYL